MIKTGILNDKVHECGISLGIHGHGDVSSPAPVETSPSNEFVEIQEDTMQVPFDSFSMMDAMMDGTEKTFDAAIYQYYNAHSHWDFGESHSKSIREVGQTFSVSPQYVQQAVSRLTGKWMERMSGKHKISKFKLVHHLCEKEEVPLDRDGRPRKCAMPRGNGGLFERMQAGDIGWKSVMIWMVLKTESDFRTGVTKPIGIKEICKRTRFGTTTVCDCIKELEEAGMLKKLERRPQEAQAYQLHPKPYTEPRPRTPEAERSWRAMRVQGNWRYSFNEQWRINVETLDIEYRPDRKTPFKKASDYQKVELMPARLREDFDHIIFFHTDPKMREYREKAST